MAYYFIIYEDRPIEQPDNYVPLVKNVITALHPLVWIDATTDVYRKHFVTYIHSWRKVGDHEAIHCKGVHKENMDSWDEKPSVSSARSGIADFGGGHVILYEGYRRE